MSTQSGTATQYDSIWSRPIDFVCCHEFSNPDKWCDEIGVIIDTRFPGRAYCAKHARKNIR